MRGCSFHGGHLKNGDESFHEKNKESVTQEEYIPYTKVVDSIFLEERVILLSTTLPTHANTCIS